MNTDSNTNMDTDTSTHRVLRSVNLDVHVLELLPVHEQWSMGRMQWTHIRIHMSVST